MFFVPVIYGLLDAIFLAVLLGYWRKQMSGTSNAMAMRFD
jgi:hypothetical protein